MVIARETIDYKGQVYHPGDEVPMDDKDARIAEAAGLVEIRRKPRRRDRAARDQDTNQGGDQWPES